MSDLLRAAFHRLSESLHPAGAFAPAPYQLAVAEALLSGRRVVLRAPAGSGKSLAGWLPWLAGRQEAHDFPVKMLHILPGGAFLRDTERTLDTLLQPLHGPRVGIQTEGDAFDPFFLADATITSVDEVLSIALHRPLGLYPGLTNINAGAMLGAYLVFDEFPALTSRDALALWLGLLRQYYPITSCLFSTAVWPRALCRNLAHLLDAEFIDAGDFEMGGRRQWSTYPTLGAEAILRHHQGRTLVVCNTVRGAQLLYRTLQKTLGKAPHDEVLLLHQHLLARDRRPVEERVARIFGPGGTGEALLVTTSGIKAGADISADTLITDSTTPDRLLGRAGRCARFTGQLGRVIVARITDLPPGDRTPGPPSESLTALLADGRMVNGAEELAALDTIWETAHPEDVPDVLREPLSEREVDDAPRQVFALNGRFPDRLFSRVGVCLHLVPETVQDPFELERFSLAISSLERGWRQWSASGSSGEWFALVPRWATGELQTPTWSLVEHPWQFNAETQLIVLNTEAVSYDHVIGLELSPGTPYQSERLPQQHTSWFPFDQHMQSFHEHAMRSLEAYERLIPWYRYVLRHLGRHWQLPSMELEQWLRLCILWHDAGKLTADWQDQAHRWQAEHARRPVQGLLARIDFDARHDGPFPCPPHARVSGIALSRVFGVLLNMRPHLLEGTLAALGHHHGTLRNLPPELPPHPEAWAELIGLAGLVCDVRQVRRLDRAGWMGNTRNLPAISERPPADPNAWMAYCLLVRAIRLADRDVALDDVLE